MTAARARSGAISLSISSIFPINRGSKVIKPVMLPFGRAKHVHYLRVAGLTRTEARRSCGRIIGHGQPDTAKKLSPRCSRCTATVLKKGPTARSTRHPHAVKAVKAVILYCASLKTTNTIFFDQYTRERESTVVDHGLHGPHGPLLTVWESPISRITTKLQPLRPKKCLIRCFKERTKPSYSPSE